jgi:hypothetical protein
MQLLRISATLGLMMLFTSVGPAQKVTTDFATAVWRGMSTKTLSDKPQRNAESLNKAIVTMFKNFPPSGAAARH